MSSKGREGRNANEIFSLSPHRLRLEKILQGVNNGFLRHIYSRNIQLHVVVSMRVETRVQLIMTQTKRKKTFAIEIRKEGKLFLDT